MSTKVNNEKWVTSLEISDNFAGIWNLFMVKIKSSTQEWQIDFLEKSVASSLQCFEVWRIDIFFHPTEVVRVRFMIKFAPLVKFLLFQTFKSTIWREKRKGRKKEKEKEKEMV